MGITKELLNAIDAYIGANYVEDFIIESGCCEEDEEECLEIIEQNKLPEIQIYEKPEVPKKKAPRSIFGGKRSKLKVAGEAKCDAIPMPMLAVGPKKRSLDNLVNELGETFSQKLIRLIDERQLKDSDVYNKAHIDRRHFSKIHNDENYAPTKKTVFAFSIALELSLDESIDLLKSAGYTFSNSSKFDIIVRYFIENKEYDMNLINDVLDQYGQQVLGA